MKMKQPGLGVDNPETNCKNKNLSFSHQTGPGNSASSSSSSSNPGSRIGGNTASSSSITTNSITTNSSSNPVGYLNDPQTTKFRKHAAKELEKAHLQHQKREAETRLLSAQVERRSAPSDPESRRRIQEYQIAQTKPLVEQKMLDQQAQRDLKNEKLRVERAEYNSNMLNILNTSYNPNVLIEDTANIGARGYVHNNPNLPNQPYASCIADHLLQQNIVGHDVIPNMDANANQFLAQALINLRPEVYGPNPKTVGKNLMINRRFIERLRVC
jgi:hypothetical protein